MKHYIVYDKNTANEESAQLLNAVEGMISFIPNIFGVIAESSPALQAFVELNNQLSKSSFGAIEREIIQTAVSVENQCNYCVAGHTAFAHMQDVPAEIIEAVRNNQAIKYSKKLEALNQFTRTLVRSKGMIPSQAQEDFLAAGYTHAQVLEVILGICVKTFSNLTNNTIGIPLDDEFRPYKWQPIETNQAA